jgi:hypothetical protein
MNFLFMNNKKTPTVATVAESVARIANLHSALELRQQLDDQLKALTTLPAEFKAIPNGMTLQTLTNGLKLYNVDDKYSVSNSSHSVLGVTVICYADDSDNVRAMHFSGSDKVKGLYVDSIWFKSGLAHQSAKLNEQAIYEQKLIDEKEKEKLQESSRSIIAAKSAKQLPHNW